jgi:DNA-binding response OmpR family regulator
MAESSRFDLVVLDVMLPGVDGLEVCRRLREDGGPPVILLTARSGESDKVIGLDLGADDYVVKPFSPRELMARVRALLRRGRGASVPLPALESDGLRLDPSAVRVEVDGRPVALTASEFRLLQALMSNAGRVLDRDALIVALHDGDDPGIIDRAVDVHVGRLRRKLGDPAARPRFIETVRSVGYRFVRRVTSVDEGDGV